jgi:uncharacterized SAM-binding protein YcdF (DUF218 family)
MLEEQPAVRSRIRGAGAGIALTVGTWLVVGILGVPALLGLGAVAELPWIALFGAALGAIRFLGPVRLLLGFAVTAIFVVSFFPFLDNRIAGMVRSDGAGGSRVDAVIVLSASLTSGGELGRVAQERLVSGMLLRRELAAPNLVLTTVLHSDRTRMAVAEQHQRLVVGRLDPDAVLHLVGPTRDTHEEAIAAEALARRSGWHQVAVVTSPLHTRRACATFEAQGLLVICRPSEQHRLGDSDRWAPGDRLAAFQEWLYETVGIAAYRRRGWISRPAKRNVQARLRRIHDAPALRSLARNRSVREAVWTDRPCRWLQKEWVDGRTRFRRTT